ncbi:MAG: hypothetical protein HUK08_06260 [Bacteroidaceae bacterium]|nr:hypothetical protein [Bacteroidaceae bacterium]
MKRALPYILLLAATILIAIVLQALQEYFFYYKEPDNLWLNDRMWIMPHFAVAGGISQLATSAFTQCFGFKYAGACMVAAVFGIVLFILWKIQRQFGIRDYWASLWLLPTGFMALCHETPLFSINGHTALMLSLLIALATLMLKGRTNKYLDCAVSAITIAAAYWICGSTAVVCTLIILLYDLLKTRNWLSAIACPIVLFAASALAVRAKTFASMEMALTPLQYYDWPTTYFFQIYCWASIILILIGGSLFAPEKQARSLRIRSIVFIGAALLSAVVFVRLYTLVHNPKQYLLRHDEWHANRGEWNEIIAAHEGLQQQTPLISYLNLALAEKGILVERMADFNPYIVYSEEDSTYVPILMTQEETSRDALALQSCVYMRLEGSAIANAQKSAFEANLLTPGMTNPTELMRLVTTNTLFDTEKTADKYLRRLMRTTFHSDEAEQMLKDKSRLKAEVERLRETLPAKNSFHMKTQVGMMLKDIAYNNPKNKIAAQFYEAYLIQTRDEAHYKEWKEHIITNSEE